MEKYVELTPVKKGSGMTGLTSHLRAEGVSKDREGQDIVTKRPVHKEEKDSPASLYNMFEINKVKKKRKDGKEKYTNPRLQSEILLFLL